MKRQRTVGVGGKGDSQGDRKDGTKVGMRVSGTTKCPQRVFELPLQSSDLSGTLKGKGIWGLFENVV
ncbi:hypothetical protein EK904_006391 [Melospiza melodia maxima]|nr:hypothetical protein EK904_006391 [Melospiza melodia maxima]